MAHLTPAQASRRVARAALAVVAAVASSCNRDVAPAACATHDDCPAGWFCLDDACEQVCVRDLDCSAERPVCRDGVCQAAPQGDCDVNADCRAPTPCEVLPGAVCSDHICYYNAAPPGRDCDDGDSCTTGDACTAGECHGTPLACMTPPAAECVGGDSVYRGYPSVGVCTSTTGRCVYAPQDFPCSSCTATCLGRCATVTCPDLDGGCRWHGVCDPTSQQCLYSTHPDGVPCALGDQPEGSAAGVCASGKCAGCVQPGDCRTPPGGRTDCYEPACAAGVCTYAAIPGPDCPATPCSTQPTGAPCSDNNPCTYDDRCRDDGRCTGTVMTCTDDLNVCGARRTCNGTVACTTSWPDATTPCDDLNPCTYDDRCDGAGGCASAGSLICANDPAPCGAERTCDGTATCALTYPGGTVACDDARLDTCNDVCNGTGGCSGTLVSCPNTDACNLYSFNGTCTCTVSQPSGNDCGVCRSCNGAGACVGNSADHGDCGVCEKCSGGSCVLQSAAEDIKAQCALGYLSCTADTCSGGGPYCGTLPDGTQCDNYGSYYCVGGACNSSCPFIFAWRDGAWRYVTDDAGNATGMPSKHALRGSGLSQYYGPRLIVLGALDRDRDGLYRVKIREPLHELDFVDELALVAIDHPLGTEVVSSSAQNRIEDRVRYRPELITLRVPVPPLAATDWLDRDILAAVTDADGWAAPADASPRHYTFDFGPLLDRRHAKLVLDAWGMFGARFATGERLRSHLLVVDAHGEWVRVKDIGYPAGDAKRLAIDIADVFLSDDHRIRVQTGTGPGGMMRWTIDRAMLDTSAPEPVVVRELPALYAALGHKGGLDYVAAGPTNRYLVTDDETGTASHHLGFGAFTRFGEVTPLLARQDDEFVVMQHGDELVVAFADLSAPPPGMTRTWALKSALIYKQHYRDRQVEPMPFWGMVADPPPAAALAAHDRRRAAYRAAYNTRHYRDGGRREPLTDPWRATPLTVTIAPLVNDSPLGVDAEALRAALALAVAPVARIAPDAEATLAGVIAGIGLRCQATLTLVDGATNTTMREASVDAVCSPQDVERALYRAVALLNGPDRRCLAAR